MVNSSGESKPTVWLAPGHLVEGRGELLILLPPSVHAHLRGPGGGVARQLPVGRVLRSARETSRSCHHSARRCWNAKRGKPWRAACSGGIESQPRCSTTTRL